MNQIVDPMKYDHFGYEFAQPIKNSFGVPQVHPGYDFNLGSPYADEGKDVFSCYEGRVIYSGYAFGWGNMVVIYHKLPFPIIVNGHEIDEFWTRSTHLKDIAVALNKYVSAGELIGHCGHTGGNWAPHLHHDLFIKHPKKWTNYTSWWSVVKTKENYADFFEIQKQFNEIVKKKDSKEHVTIEQNKAEIWNKFMRTGLVKKHAKPEMMMTLMDFALIYFKMKS